MTAADPLTTALISLNDLLAAAVLIISFSLLAYVALQNRETPVAKAIGVLLFGVTVVFGGDVLIGQAQREPTVLFLLRAQWLGIVTVPVGYVQLADALLSTSGFEDRRRRALVWVAVAISAALFALAFATDLLLRESVVRGVLAQFGAGPLFWLFAAYFGAACGFGLYAALRVRRVALTPTNRRRLSYLALTFLAPGMAVFPYLSVASLPAWMPDALVLGLTIVGNGTAITMMVGMVYSAAFQGMRLPDRVIKQDFIRWVLYGPVVGVTLVLFLRFSPILARGIGLPTDTVLTLGIMMMTVVMPIFVSRVKPIIDTLVFAQDHGEIDAIRQLPQNTFTQADLRTLLENMLTVACGALRIDTGFVAAPDEIGGYTVKSLVGARRVVQRLLADHPLSEMIMALQGAPASADGEMPMVESFVKVNGFSLFALRGPDGAIVGALGAALPRDGLTIEQRRTIGAVAHSMGLALQTVQMQRRLFGALRGMAPEMESLQQLNTRLEQATPASIETLETDVALLPEFPQLVKEALTQYWGGPKLSDSPLLGLRTVRRLIADQGGSPTRALQAVLRQAILNLRPDAQLDPSAQEWVMYNILEMRFLQGKQVRDTADKLALSESDLYRKQRIAVEEVARQLALMEETGA